MVPHCPFKAISAPEMWLNDKDVAWDADQLTGRFGIAQALMLAAYDTNTMPL